MTGCRVGAKNTTVKNYLHLAERAGAVVQVGGLPDEQLAGLVGVADVHRRPQRRVAQALGHDALQAVLSRGA